jgi:uncharacterized protein YbaR (Trm112 family)
LAYPIGDSIPVMFAAGVRELDDEELRPLARRQSE